MGCSVLGVAPNYRIRKWRGPPPATLPVTAVELRSCRQRSIFRYTTSHGFTESSRPSAFIHGGRRVDEILSYRLDQYLSNCDAVVAIVAWP